MNTLAEIKAVTDERTAVFMAAREAYLAYLAENSHCSFARLSETDYARARQDPRLAYALETFAKAGEMAKTNGAYEDVATSQYQRGMALHCMGAFADAEAALQTALNIFESSPNLDITRALTIGAIFYHLAILKVRQNDRDGGLAHLRQALAYDEAFMDMGGISLDREALEIFGGEHE